MSRMKLLEFPSLMVAALFLLATTFGCSMIDDDLDDCGVDYKIDYHIHVVTNVDVRIGETLQDAGDAPIAESLRRYIEERNNSGRHSLDLSFYESAGTQNRLYHESHDITGNEASFTLYLDAQNYLHLPTANVEQSGVVTSESGEDAYTARLQQQQGDTIDSHATAIYTGREQFTVADDQDEDLRADLYQANSTVAVVIDTAGYKTERLQVFVTDLADGFNPADSTYTYNDNPLLRAREVSADTGTETAFVAMGFPSRDTAPGTIDPTVAAAAGAVWRIVVLATMPDGSITQTVIYMQKPLQAGDIQVIKLKMNANGSMGAAVGSLGTSVTLDWHNGGEYHI